MNKPARLASFCATLLLCGSVTAHAATPPNPISPPPKADAQTQHVLAAMNNASTWGHPDLFGEFAGMRLYAKGDYKAALKYFEYGARYADKLSQLSIGLMYANGRGVDRDPITACAWLALAAQRKFPSFVATRDRVCTTLTSTQRDQAIAVLNKLLPVYGDAVAKKRMVRALQFAKMEMTGSRLGSDSGVMQVAASTNCGGPTVSQAGVDVPVAGCGDPHYYDASRWDPKQYFAARDARWRGTVTVGAIQSTKAPAASSPASASSAGH
jgi:hypothetical protein